MTDRTAEIYAWLGITPETHSDFYNVHYEEDVNHDPVHEVFTPIYLLTGTLEADGMAVRLVEIASDRVNYLHLTPCKNGDWCVNWGDDTDPDRTIYNNNLAHAVHDALCEAMEEGSVEDE